MNPPHPAAGVRVLGILNLTRDSYSDGGRYLKPDAAIAHARRLRADGAAWIDVGAESSHPDAEAVPAAEEFARLAAVIPTLKADGATVSVDTSKPDVMRSVLALGADAINDIRGFRDPAAVDAVRASNARLICMFNRTAADPSGRARRHAAAADPAPAALLNEIERFFEERLAALAAAGVARERIILDPGMGFFLGGDPALSCTVLRELPRLQRFGRPLCVSPSRKSFIGALLAGPDGPRPVAERGVGTLAAELWAAAQGVAYIRTHDVRALADGLRMQAAIRAAAADAAAHPPHPSLE